MRPSLRCLVLALSVAALAASWVTAAQDCNSPPQGFGSAWASQYAAWCQNCGGTVTGSGPGIGCNPGPNWGRGNSGSGAGSGSGSASNSAALAAQAEQEAADRKKRENDDKLQKEQEEAEARRRKFQEEQESLTKKIKGAAEAGFEPRGVSLPNQSPVDASVVDLRHLDPDRPIVVDPNVVKGKPRVFPAQVPLKTLENPNYKKGFESLMAGTPLVALSYFNEAKKELPGDLMVGHALGLTQDIIKARREKAESDIERRALEESVRGYAVLQAGDLETAMACYSRASGLMPLDQSYYDESHALIRQLYEANLATGGPKSAQQKAQKMKAREVARGSILALQRGDCAGAARILKAALVLSPGEPTLGAMLHKVQGLEEAQKTRDKSMGPQR